MDQAAYKIAQNPQYISHAFKQWKQIMYNLTLFDFDAQLNDVVNMIGRPPAWLDDAKTKDAPV
jgi:hypothetical protein